MAPIPQKSEWQLALMDLITDPKELFDLLELDFDQLEGALAAAKNFKLKMPRTYAERIEKKNPKDPLLLQALPQANELNVVEGFSLDPLEEKKASPLPGLFHKYEGRILITLTGACGIHCRYCFRRHFAYEENMPSRQGLENIFNYIRNDISIQEVILSGGDPLVVSDQVLMHFCEQLAGIPHVTTLRIHSRLPIVIPSRITHTFVQGLAKTRFKVVIIVHANHPKEIDPPVKKALLDLKHHGLTVLNQSVLLKDINDDARILAQLSIVLFDAGVLPYYLHLLDKVKGAAHFEVTHPNALRIHRFLRQKLPGYLVPRLVYEQAGEHSKTIVS